MRRLPIGIENFEHIIKENYYYVDKTLFIKEFLERHDKVNLFTRPRRFGKSLNMSMFKEFFELSGEGSELFQGLAIAQYENMMEEYCGKYPVICLSFKDANDIDFSRSTLSMIRELSREYERHLDAVLAYPFQTKRINRILNAECTYEDCLDAILLLTKILYKYHNKQVIVIIDEYDVPLEHAYNGGFYEEMMGFVRSLLQTALKTNNNLKFGILSGCLRISRESIFTGLNNLSIISILNDNYSEHFGFTEDQVIDMLEYYGISNKFDLLKEWYNGYEFGCTNIYNPWSVIQIVRDLIQNNNAYPISYWGNTSSNSIVRDLILKANATTKEEIERLLDGKTIVKQIHEDITYMEIEKSINNLWNFLLFTGYLTKSHTENYDNGDRFLTLKIPNKEVAYIYRNKIINWFNESISKRNWEGFYEALLEKNTSFIQNTLNDILIDSISYEDYHENYYHGFMIGLLSSIDSQNYIVESNRETGKGRGDIIVRHVSPTGKAVIFEIKYTDKMSTMEARADSALTQIDEKEYDRSLLQAGFAKDNIIKYGVCFYKKTCFIKAR